MGETRTRRWLDRHGAKDRTVTPLLTARLDARRRGDALSMVVITVATVVYLGVAAFAAATRGGPTALSLITVFYVALALAAIVSLWVQGRGERRVARALSRRVAHPVAVRVGTVVGRWCVIAAVLVFGAGGLVSVVAAVTAPDPDDRRLGLILLGAIGAFALIGLAGLVQVVRRPAIADDEQSLVDDLLLRREDALRAVIPYPALLALIAAVQSRDLPILLGFLAYAVIAAAAWLVANWATTHAAAARPGASSRLVTP